MSSPGAAGSGAVAAVDLGATSGRVMIGRIGPGVLALEPVARFPNGPVERADGWHWDFAALFGHVVAGLRDAVLAEPHVASIRIYSLAVDDGPLRDGELLTAPFHSRHEPTTPTPP